jgi:hypothetical protein
MFRGRDAGRASNSGDAAEYWISRFRGNDTAELVNAAWFHFAERLLDGGEFAGRRE